MDRKGEFLYWQYWACIATHLADSIFSTSSLSNHGYDATHPDMHALFLALGPSVLPRSHPKMPAFRNVEVHNLAMKMLGVQPVQNDGTPGFWDTYIERPVHQRWT